MCSGADCLHRPRLVPVQALDAVLGKALREGTGQGRVEFTEDDRAGWQTLEVRQLAVQVRVLHPAAYQSVEVHAVSVCHFLKTTFGGAGLIDETANPLPTHRPPGRRRWPTQHR